jgi:hypothetical protein
MSGLIGSLTADQQIELIYVGYFNGAADGGGFAFWEQQYATATSSGGESPAIALSNIANSFIHQMETLELYPILSTNLTYPVTDPFAQGELSSLINSIYINVFGHAADPGGATYWAGQLESGAVPLGKAILAIANGALGGDAIILQNKITAADFFTLQTSAAGLGLTAPLTSAFFGESHAVLQGIDSTALNDASVADAEAATMAFIASSITPPAPPGPSTFTLTTAIDNIMSANAQDAVAGTLTGTNATSTLNPGDQMAMAGGTIEITDTNPAATSILAAVDITGSFKFLVHDLAAAQSYDFTGLGETTVASSNSLFSCEFTNLANGAAVIASGGGTAATANVSFTMAATNAAVSEGVDGGISGVTISNEGSAGGDAAPTSATITSTGVANGSAVHPDTFVLTDGAQASVAALTVNATCNLVASLTAGDFSSAGVALTVAGAASSVTLELPAGTWKSIDAAGLTAGGVTVNCDAYLVSFVGGGGGDNNLTSPGGAPGTAISLAATAINGGDGLGNVLASNLVDSSNKGIFTNWQILDVTNQGGVTLDAGTMPNEAVSGLQFSGDDVTLETALNLAPAITVTQSGSGIFDLGQTITHSSSSGDMSALVLNNTSTMGVANFFGIFTATGDVSDTISSLAATDADANVISQILMTDNHLTTVTINGAAQLFLGGDTGASNGDAIATNTGLAAAGSATTTASSLSLIDASTTSGGVLIYAGASTTPSANNTITYTGLTIKGGSGADFIENDANGGTVIDGNGSDIVVLGGSGITATLGTGPNNVYIGLSSLGTTETAGSALGASLTFANAATAHLVLYSGAELGSVAGPSPNTNLGQNAFNSANINGATTGTLIEFSTFVGDSIQNAQPVADGVASLDAKISQVAAWVATTNTITGKGVGFFTFGADEYLVAVSTPGEANTSASDYVVHLVGVNNLIHPQLFNGFSSGTLVQLA